jgi:hypothetical protein
MRVYISGPMTGQPRHNFPAFFAAEQRWRDAGWDVSNPARNFGGRLDLDRVEYMRCDVGQLLEVDAIAFLPGWKGSRGALVELAIAEELGLDLFDAETMLPVEYGTQIIGLEVIA